MAFVMSLSLLLVTRALAGSRNKQLMQKAGPNLYEATPESSAQVEKLDAVIRLC